MQSVNTAWVIWLSIMQQNTHMQAILIFSFGLDVKCYQVRARIFLSCMTVAVSATAFALHLHGTRSKISMYLSGFLAVGFVCSMTKTSIISYDCCKALTSEVRQYSANFIVRFNLQLILNETAQTHISISQVFNRALRIIIVILYASVYSYVRNRNISVQINTQQNQTFIDLHMQRLPSHRIANFMLHRSRMQEWQQPLH